MNDKVIVYNRLNEVVPIEMLENLSYDEIKIACKVAFNIIGHIPKNLDKSIEVAWESSEAIALSDFIYDVWEVEING